MLKIKFNLIETFLAPPSWISEPQDQIISEGKSFKIPCEAVGYPKPSVQWKTGIYALEEVKI